MKQLYELDEKVSKDDLPDIYCDMDMVLCDFMTGADKAVGEPFIHADRETRWQKISNTKGFWEGLDCIQAVRDYILLLQSMTHIYFLRIVQKMRTPEGVS